MAEMRKVFVTRRTVLDNSGEAVSYDGGEKILPAVVARELFNSGNAVYVDDDDYNDEINAAPKAETPVETTALPPKGKK